MPPNPLADRKRDRRFRHSLRRVTRAPLRAIATWGVALAVLLAAGLVLVLAQDRHNRLAAAQRQSLALATGSDRLLQLQLDNLGQALHGEGLSAQALLAETPVRASELIAASLHGLRRGTRNCATWPCWMCRASAASAAPAIRNCAPGCRARAAAAGRA